MKKIFLPFFVFLLPPFIYPQWYNYNNDPTLSNTYFNSVNFVDTLNGWIACDNGLIIHTTDAGLSWNRQTSGFTGHLRKVRFSDLLHGWVVGDSGKILRTTNGGETWISQKSGGSWTLHILSIFDTLSAWIVGNNGRICLRTSDGGKSWDSVDTKLPTNHTINDLFLIDSTRAWYCTGYYVSPFTGGIINYTSDGGLNWITKNQTGNIFWSISFIDENNGWCSSDLRVYYTKNGNSWNVINFPNQWFYHIRFIDTSIGWIIQRFWTQNRDQILFTSDGGYNWTIQVGTPYGKYITDICFVEKTHGWAVGQLGLILHTTNGGGALTSTENEIPDLVSSFSLSQNYPNPFNPSTKISYSIPCVGAQCIVPVQLKVFDILGNEVATLVDEYKSAGNYEVEFPNVGMRHTSSAAKILPSGVYFYQLKAGNFIQTKKMLLLR